MVGLVLVSHSAELAASVKSLADQQTQGRAAIAAVGGTGDPEQPFGTDAMAILDAIQSVYDEDGVLVLMDLGSALLSAEMALEFMDPEQASRVLLSPGPFVEGAMAASVQASIGMDLESVYQEAAEAMGPKAETLGTAVGPEKTEAARVAAGAAPTDGEAPVGPEQEADGKVTLTNHAGLHFGPAVLFVQAAAGFRADIRVRNLATGTGPVDAKRFNQVLSLGAEQGHEIGIRCAGPDAEAALHSLLALAKAGFGEESPAPISSVSASPAKDGADLEAQGRLTLAGIAASPGVAVGTAFVLAKRAPRIPRFTAKDPAREWSRFQAAVTQASTELDSLAQRMARELGPEQARIFQAHILALADPDLQAAVENGIYSQHQNAEAALHDVIEDQARSYEAMSGPRFQERAADLRDVGVRVLRLLGDTLPPEGGARSAEVVTDQSWADLPAAAVIIADDLAPSQTAALDRERVVAFCTALGGPTAHTAILARSMGIPAVVGMGEEALTELVTGVPVAVNGGAGTVVVEPDEATVAVYTARRAEDAAAHRVAWAAAQAAARTRDGRRVEVVANLATVEEATVALDAGAEGVGLLRTEFLFQDRTEPPSEEEQVAVYRQVAEIMHPRPVIIRTLDIGGDKPAPYLQIPAESNPFLGWRAIRICLAMPEFFKTQLRAILRAGVLGNLRVMFPMVATSREVEEALALLARAAEELREEGFEHTPTLPAGIMVEIPATVQVADLLAPLVDFFSIGTNDLTQYTFAADRTNARVAQLADPMHPAVLRQVAHVIESAHAAGKWVGLCGELAGQPEAIPLLLGLELDEFSMSIASIPEAKALLARLSAVETQELAQTALKLPDGRAVRAAVREFLRDSANPSSEDRR